MSAVDVEGGDGIGRGATKELAIGLELNSWLRMDLRAILNEPKLVIKAIR